MPSSDKPRRLKDTKNTKGTRRTGRAQDRFLRRLLCVLCATFVSLWLLPCRSTASQRNRRLHPAAKPAHASRAAIKAKISTVNHNIREAKTQLTGVKQDIRNAQAQLRVQKARVARLADQVRELQVREDESTRRASTAKKRLALAEKRVAAATIRLQLAERRLAAHRRRLSRRIARSYTAGPVTFVDVLMRACSLSDFLDRQYYVERIFTSDVEFLSELRAEQQVVAQERARLDQERAEQANAKEEMDLQLREVQSLKQSRAQLFERVKDEKELKEEELRELEQDSTSIANLLEREWQRRQDLWSQFYHGRNVPMARWPGHWLRPVSGFPISSGFGMRYHPILHYARLHTGIDFAAPVGTPIRPAADGEVLWASWRGGYGRCIIVLHAGGVATLYGHCSEIVVHAGQGVKASTIDHPGTIIGYTGNTGLSTGPHLHFEMRVNGQPVNPIGH
jgi:murein DD-endopeptidase MepM/ murein hydrolase activator NlpD